MSKYGENFAVALEHILEFEGGYVDHPKDPGGATNFGITRKTLASWRGVSPWWDLPKLEVKGLNHKEVAEIYFHKYWIACGADQLPPASGLTLFDYAVNSGPTRALKGLQMVLKIHIDGVFGNSTKQAFDRYVERLGEKHLVTQLVAQRHSFLKRLSSYKIFGKGWSNRLAALKQMAMKIAKPNKPKKDKQSMSILAGYKTYLVAISMLISGVLELSGVDLPALESGNALQLIMEALAVIFLRKGLNSEIANA